MKLYVIKEELSGESFLLFEFNTICFFIDDLGLYNSIPFNLSKL